jgi:hypothetical protein
MTDRYLVLSWRIFSPIGNGGNASQHGYEHHARHQHG